MKPQLSADATGMGFALLSRALIAILIVCAYPPVTHAETVQPLWSYAHPNARSLIGVNIRQVRQSPLGRSLEEQWLPTLGKAIPGIDLLDPVDRVLISSPGAKRAEDSAEPPILITIRGSFDLTRVREILCEQKATLQIFDSAMVYRPQGITSKEFAIALIDNQTILVGDAQSIFSTIERLGLPGSDSMNDLLSRAQELDTRYDFWALMSAPGALSSQRLPFAGFIHGLKSLDIGISATNGFSVDASILAGNEKKARELKDQLGKLRKLIAKDEVTRPELALIAKKTKLSTEGSRLALSIRIAESEVEWGLRSVQARRSAKISIAAKPQRQTIRIDGLDEGPRELVLIPNR